MRVGGRTPTPLFAHLRRRRSEIGAAETASTNACVEADDESDDDDESMFGAHATDDDDGDGGADFLPRAWLAWLARAWAAAAAQSVR